MRRLKSLLCVFPLLFFAWGCKNDAADGDFELSKTKTLATPKNFTAVYDPVNNVTNFTWEEVPSATGYSVMESVNGKISDAVKIIPAATGTSGTVIGYSAKIQSFSYWLIAYNDSEESEITECRQIVTSAPKLAISAASCNESGVVSLEWTAAEGVSGYRVSYKNTGEGISEWTEFNQTLSANVDAGETYSAVVTLAAYAPSIDYRVRAVKGSASDETEWSEPKTVQINLFPPRNIGAESTGTYGEAKIVWDKIDGVTYNVYKSLGTDGEKTLLSSEIGNPASGNPNFTAQDLTKGTWYFWVESCVDGNKKCSTEGAAYTVKIPAPKNIRITERTETSLTVSWDVVSYHDIATNSDKTADCYKVSVYDDTGATLVSENSTNSLSMGRSSLQSGTTYLVRVVGYESPAMTEAEEGEIPSWVEAKTLIAKPEFSSEHTWFSSDYAYIGWNAVKGASSYEVAYSGSDGDSAYVESLPSDNKGFTTDTQISLTGLDIDTVYYYWVRAIDGDYKTEWTAGSGRTASVPTNIAVVETSTGYSVTWDVRGSATKFRVSYCTSATNGSVDTTTKQTLTPVENTHSCDVSSIINNRTDGTIYYYFTVEAYNSYDGSWVQGSDSEGYGYVTYGLQYGEMSQIPSGATYVSTRTYFNTTNFTRTFIASSTTTTKCFYFKATKGKRYTIYYADMDVYTSFTSSSKADMEFTYYYAGNSNSNFIDRRASDTFTCEYDAYIVVECKKYKYSSSTSGYFGIQVVESN